MEQKEQARPRREHPRVPANFVVHVEMPGGAVKARARDLSMAGLYLDAPLKVPDRVQVLLVLGEEIGSVVTTCEVERRDEHGVALSFARIDWDELMVLARFLSPRL
ncbi:MAG: PilZ domain-containing protein [Myxococcales bacterium]